MSRELSTETKASYSLLEKHLELLAIRYRIAPTDGHWLTLQRYIQQLPREDAGNLADYDFRETIKRLVVSHWQLLQPHEEEPPTYLVMTIDEIEQRGAGWFSYRGTTWMDD